MQRTPVYPANISSAVGLNSQAGHALFPNGLTKKHLPAEATNALCLINLLSNMNGEAQAVTVAPV